MLESVSVSVVVVRMCFKFFCVFFLFCLIKSVSRYSVVRE